MSDACTNCFTASHQCVAMQQLDQELLLGAQQRQQQHSQPMSSPFARATMGSAFGDGSHRHGTPPLDLGHAISLPNPDALRAAGVSPGLGAGLHTAHSGSLGASNSAFAANSRVQVLLVLRFRVSSGGYRPSTIPPPLNPVQSSPSNVCRHCGVCSATPAWRGSCHRV
jgi:hypothetical protein